MTRGATLALHWLERLAPVAVFAICIALTFEAHREQLNPDGTSYIRRAMYLLNGDLRSSASAYWSPMISWCVAPLIAAGIDGVHAIHYVLAIWGGVSVVGFGALLRAGGSLTSTWRTPAAAAFAVVAARGCMRHTSPDTILVALLLLYFALTVRRDLLERPVIAVAAGMIGGLAFLAKAYALPFVALHLPMSIVILAWVYRRELGTRRDALRKCVVTALVAAGGFAAVALPWVGVLTWKYGKLTVTSVGARSHALAGPAQRGEYYIEFFLPNDPMILQWEDPERLRYSYWSPLADPSNFVYQAALVAANVGETFRVLGEVAWGYAVWAGLALSAAALAGWTYRGPGRWRVGWLLLSLALYCGGFMPMLLTSRYLIEFSTAMTLLLCLELATRFGTGGDRGGWRWVRGALAVAFMAAFVGPAMAAMRREPVEGPASTKGPRRVAALMEKRGLRGPIASPYVPQSRMVAFFAGQKEIGFPEGTDVEAIERRLRGADVGVVLVVAGTRGVGKGADAEAAQKLVRRPGWRRVVKEGATEVWAPPWR